MEETFALPPLGDKVESGDVLSLLVREGEAVAIDQELLEVEADKATVMIRSPWAGRIVRILVTEGQEVCVGDPVFEFERSAT